MRGVDVAFQRLQPVALPLPRPQLSLLRWAQHRFEHRQRRRYLALAHVNKDEPVALDDAVRLGPDLLAEVMFGRNIGHVEAIAFGIEFPAVVDASQPALLVAAKEQRGATVRAAVVENPDATGAVAERDEPFAQEHQPQ